MQIIQVLLVNTRLNHFRIEINLFIEFSANRPTAKTVAARVGHTRPRPQPIAGTPPPDPNEKCDANIIQQTCNLFGLDLVSLKHFPKSDDALLILIYIHRNDPHQCLPHEGIL